jgi:hypothetical protein
MFLAAFFTLSGLPLAISLFSTAQASKHSEAPITAIDRTADITDWFAFRSYESGRQDTITMILGVDPLLEPSNGPNYFPFDPEIIYRMNLDNDRDGVEDIIWEFRFTTEIRLPGVFTGFVGAGQGVNAPANAPTALDGSSTVGAPIVPPAITALDGPGSEGLSLRQTYTVSVLDGVGNIIAGPFSQDLNGDPLIAVPSNVGPRTMPNYTALAQQGIFTLPGGARVFAGTVEDPFYIDLGGAFDSLNVPVAALSDEQDADDTLIIDGARDDVSGFNVNVIAFEVAISNVTTTGNIPGADSADAVVGTYGSTLRSKTKTFNLPGSVPTLSADLVQIQRMGNPLINELIIGTGFKDLFSMSEPQDDAQFAGGDPAIPNFFLDPVAARVLNAVFGINVPNPPRTDLAPLVLYTSPICPGCGPGATGLGEGPIADLLRLNVGITPLIQANSSRLGFLVDGVGHPNGRRVFEDVTDIFLRVGAGILAGGIFDDPPNNLLGDGVNTNDMPYQPVFPYVAFAQSGRDSRHIDRGEPVALGGNGGGGGGGGGCAVAGAASENIGTAAVGFGVFLIPVLYVFGRRFVNKTKSHNRERVHNSLGS